MPKAISIKSKVISHYATITHCLRLPCNKLIILSILELLIQFFFKLSSLRENLGNSKILEFARGLRQTGHYFKSALLEQLEQKICPHIVI